LLTLFVLQEREVARRCMVREEERQRQNAEASHSFSISIYNCFLSAVIVTRDRVSAHHTSR
jgi:hypothetical protein